MHVADAVRRLVPEILGPVGGVGDLRARADDRAHVGRERLQLARRTDSSPRERSVVSPRSSEPIRNASTPPASRAEMRVVQHHAPKAPLLRRRIVDASRRRRRSRAAPPSPKNAATCAAAPARLVRRCRLARRRRAGDPPAPGIGRLPRPALSRGPAASLPAGDVHQHERVEGHPDSRAPSDPRSPAPPTLRRRAAIGRPARRSRLTSPPPPRSTPLTGQVARRRRLVATSTPGRMRAMAGAQIVAEPGDHQRRPIRGSGAAPAARRATTSKSERRAGVDVLRPTRHALAALRAGPRRS